MPSLEHVSKCTSQHHSLATKRRAITQGVVEYHTRLLRRLAPSSSVLEMLQPFLGRTGCSFNSEAATISDSYLKINLFDDQQIFLQALLAESFSWPQQYIPLLQEYVQFTAHLQGLTSLSSPQQGRSNQRGSCLSSLAALPPSIQTNLPSAIHSHSAITNGLSLFLLSLL